jgi:ABC-type amino acid transport substrate-binding protein
VKFDRAYASLYPGSIAILTRDRARATEGTASLRKVLTYAGHRVSLITSDELAATLQNGRTDIVIADGLQASLIDPQLKLLSAAPTMLYVVMDKDRKQAAGVNAAYHVKQSDKPLRWLLVIDDAMQARARSGRRVKG